MPGQVPRSVSKERYRRLMELQQEITRERLCRWVGRAVEVLVERADPSGQAGVGRTQGQSPEIDGETLLDLSALPGTRPGDFVLAEVTSAGPYDLAARAVGLEHRPPLRHPELLQIGVLN